MPLKPLTRISACMYSSTRSTMVASDGGAGAVATCAPGAPDSIRRDATIVRTRARRV